MFYVLRCGSVRFSNIVKPTVRCGAVLKRAKILRCGSVRLTVSNRTEPIGKTHRKEPRKKQTKPEKRYIIGKTRHYRKTNFIGKNDIIGKRDIVGKCRYYQKNQTLSEQPGIIGKKNFIGKTGHYRTNQTFSEKSDIVFPSTSAWRRQLSDPVWRWQAVALRFESELVSDSSIIILLLCLPPKI